ncbi:MAG: hypothetical protein IJS65_05090 [Clostridia bacterium]|nr:hypothetical protein [Clostridia bacterium]
MEKVSEIRQDNRLLYVRTIRSVSLFLLLAIFVAAIFTFYDEINVNSAQNLYAKIRASQKDDVFFESYTPDAGLSFEYDALGPGLAVIQSDFFYFITGKGRAGLKAQIKYRAPRMEVCGDKAILYDTDGEEYTVATSYAVLYHGKANGTVISASLAPGGEYALVTNPVGYRSAVTVYDAKNREKCSWETAKDYIAASAVSSKAERFAALCFAEDGLYIKCIDAQKGEQIYSKKVDGSVYDMFFEKNDLIFICGSEIIKLDEKGEQVVSSDVGDVLYVARSGVECQTVSKEDTGFVLAVFNEKLEKKREERVSGTVLGAAYSGGRSALLTDVGVTVFADGETKSVNVTGGKRVLLSPDGAPIVSFGDRIERIDISE